MERNLSFLKAPPVPKTAKLLDAARHYGCAHCGRNDGTIVAAHCNELALGRGIAHKTSDYLVAFLCSVCHDQVDGRTGGLRLEEKRAMWNRAYVVTMQWLFRDGRITIT